jgi:hypothetical protein
MTFLKKSFTGWVGALAALLVVASAHAQPAADGPAAPKLKPSKFSKAPIDITTNAYGAFGLAPKAPGIGEAHPDFELPAHTGEPWKLKDALKNGPLVLIYYRGDW